MVGGSRPVPGAVVLGRQYFRTAARLDPHERKALAGMPRALGTEWPALPGPHDVRDILAPTTLCWRRRIGASAWWLFYEIRDDGVIVVAVAIPPVP